jgi:protein involved in polysaccharide export with SLBB domain
MTSGGAGVDAATQNQFRIYQEKVEIPMKKLTLAASFLLLTVAISASAQMKSVAAANNQSAAKSPNSSQAPVSATRVRVLNQDVKQTSTGATNPGDASLQTTARADFNNHPDAGRKRTGRNASEAPKAATVKLKSLGSPGPSGSAANAVAPAAVAAASSQVYRVGVRDVLDIQLTDNPSKSSTLFTVLDGGLLEYPLAGNPIPVAGLTTAEIAGLLRKQIKILENPAVAVSVRDYASHTVSITGFVAAPGTKALRREAVPLYALLAEALVLPEAARATITRQGRQPMVIDLKNATHSSTLVIPGDVIKVAGMPSMPTEFFFIGGEISSPGQKPYHAGLTLTQSILASGGLNRSAGTQVRVSRQGADGRLSTQEYNLHKIQSGKIPDPAIQKDDRIEVTAQN